MFLLLKGIFTIDRHLAAVILYVGKRANRSVGFVVLNHGVWRNLTLVISPAGHTQTGEDFLVAYKYAFKQLVKKIKNKNVYFCVRIFIFIYN